MLYIYCHERLSGEEDIFELVKTFPFGIHFLISRSGNPSIPDPSVDGSALIRATVIEPGLTVMIEAQKVGNIYKAFIYAGSIQMNWTEV